MTGLIYYPKMVKQQKEANRIAEANAKKATEQAAMVHNANQKKSESITRTDNDDSYKMSQNKKRRKGMNFFSNESSGGEQ
jgi:hypothetical protein